MHLRPFLEVARIKPEEIETVMQLLPIGELIRNRFVKANPFWRHFKIATRTREWVWGQVWLKHDCGSRSARANLIARRRWWRTQLPIWVIFGLHRFFNVRLTTNYTDTKSFRIRKQLSIIRNNFPQMESSGFPLSETFDWWLIHKEPQKRAMILAQNELRPQEEVDENGNRGRLPTT